MVLISSFTSNFDNVLLAVESPAIRRARDSIQKGRAIIEERQKLIRLADRSEHCWMMVDEYTADDLADGSEDEKKIERAAEPLGSYSATILE